MADSEAADLPSVEAVNDWDGSWYDVDLVNSSVVEKGGKYGVKIIYQDSDEEDAELMWAEELPKRLRLSCQPVQDSECRKLQPGARVVVLAKWPNREEQKYYDAEIVLADFKEHGPDEGECGCVFTVKYIYEHEPRAKAEGEFLDPVSTQVKIDDMCFPGGSAVQHPVIQKWLQQIKEMSSAKPAQQKGLFKISTISGTAAGTEAQRQQIMRQAAAAAQQQQGMPQERKPASQQQQQKATHASATAAAATQLAAAPERRRSGSASSTVSAQQAAAAAALAGAKRPATAVVLPTEDGSAGAQAKRSRTTAPVVTQQQNSAEGAEKLRQMLLAAAGPNASPEQRAILTNLQAAVNASKAATASGKPFQMPADAQQGQGSSRVQQRPAASAAPSGSIPGSPAGTKPSTPAASSGGQASAAQQQQQQQQLRFNFHTMQQLQQEAAKLIQAQQGQKGASASAVMQMQQLQFQMMQQLQQNAAAAAAGAGTAAGPKSAASGGATAGQQQQQKNLVLQQQLILQQLQNHQLVLQQAAHNAKVMQQQKQQQQKQQQQKQQQQQAPTIQPRQRKRAKPDADASGAAASNAHKPAATRQAAANEGTQRASRAAAAAVAAATAAAASDSEASDREGSADSHAVQDLRGESAAAAADGRACALLQGEHGEAGLPADVTDAQRKYFLDNKQGKPTVWMRGEEHGFPKGWFIIERTRVTGASQGTKDRYYLSPDGRMVRTRNEALARAEDEGKFQLLVDAAEQVWEDETKLPQAESLEGPALLQHATAVQGAVMMALNEHNTVAQVASLPLRLSDITAMAKLHSSGTFRLLPAAASSLYATAAAHLVNHSQEARLTAEQSTQLLAALAVLLEVPGREEDACTVLAGTAGSAAAAALAVLAAPGPGAAAAAAADGVVKAVYNAQPPGPPKPGCMKQHKQLASLSKEQRTQQIHDCVLARTKGWYGCSPAQLNSYSHQLVLQDCLLGKQRQDVLVAAAAAAMAASDAAAKAEEAAAAELEVAAVAAAPASAAAEAKKGGTSVQATEADAVVAQREGMDIDQPLSAAAASLPQSTAGGRPGTTQAAAAPAVPTESGRSVDGEEAESRLIVAAVVAAAVKAVVQRNNAHAVISPARSDAQRRTEMLAAMSQQMAHLQTQLIDQLDDAVLVLHAELASMAPYKSYLTADNAARVDHVLESLGLPSSHKWAPVLTAPGTTANGRSTRSTATPPPLPPPGVSPGKAPVMPLPAAMQQLQRSQQQQQQKQPPQQQQQQVPAAGAKLARQASGAEAAAERMRVVGVQGFVTTHPQQAAAKQQQQQPIRPGAVPSQPAAPPTGAAAGGVVVQAPVGRGVGGGRPKVPALDPTEHGQALVASMILQLRQIVPSPRMTDAQREEFRRMALQAQRQAAATANMQMMQNRQIAQGNGTQAGQRPGTPASGTAAAPVGSPAGGATSGMHRGQPGPAQQQLAQQQQQQRQQAARAQSQVHRGQQQDGVAGGSVPQQRPGVPAGQQPPLPGQGQVVPLTSPPPTMPAMRTPSPMTTSMPAAVALVPGPGGMMMPVGIAMRPAPYYIMAPQQQQPRPQQTVGTAVATPGRVGTPPAAPHPAPVVPPAATEAMVIDG